MANRNTKHRRLLASKGEKGKMLLERWDRLQVLTKLAHSGADKMAREKAAADLKAYYSR